MLDQCEPKIEFIANFNPAFSIMRELGEEINRAEWKGHALARTIELQSILTQGSCARFDLVLVQPHRYLVREGEVSLNSNGAMSSIRMLLFNDMLLLAQPERKDLILIHRIDFRQPWPIVMPTNTGFNIALVNENLAFICEDAETWESAIIRCIDEAKAKAPANVLASPSTPYTLSKQRRRTTMFGTFSPFTRRERRQSNLDFLSPTKTSALSPR